MIVAALSPISSPLFAPYTTASPSSSQLIFLMEPPPRLSFSNSTGASVSCAAHGTPAPTITWLTEDGVPVSDVPGLSVPHAMDALLSFAFTLSVTVYRYGSIDLIALSQLGQTTTNFLII
ncbi:jg20120 [Pararge aegeria aegeria]|uniref:Jg20120 protein n=1 Tax=Pararge aegeria aegeria TaxID=348720 RepID=A0A8S4R977_9NEOP|nr:jg20120 [Pararge aegeria aegeria]